MTPAAPRFLSASSSDQGYVRDNNEDRVYTDDVRGFFLVIDGMGGHEAGEHAAEIAMERIRARLERQTDKVEQRLREAITLANNAIFEAAENRPEWNGMACVLTTAVIEEGMVTIGHVGDSRLYRIKRGLIEKITHDHSPVGEREDAGEITEAEAMKHPRRNEVYRDVGSQPHTPDDDDFIEILRIPFESDSALLLCSDGLSDAIASSNILAIVEQHAADRFAAVKELIAAATEVGKDNVSVVLVQGEKFAASFRKRAGAAPKPKKAIITDPQIAAPKPVRAEPQVIIAEPPRRPWYASSPAMLVYGLLLGAAGAYFATKYFTPPPTPPPQTIVVYATSTISAALQTARAGDTVQVEPGTYTEAVHLKDGVDLIARRPHDAIINGVVTADNVQRGRFEGFIVHATGDVGVRIRSSDVQLARDEVRDASGPGVEFTGASRGSLTACWIHDNTGSGVVVADSSSPTIENNLITSNGTAAHALRPGLNIKSNGRPRVVANLFLSNGAEPIWLPEADPDLMGRNFFLAAEKPARPARNEKPRFRIVPPAEGAREPR